MNRNILVAIALTFLAAETHAQGHVGLLPPPICALDLRTTDLRAGRRYELSWARVPDATGYVIEETGAAAGTVNRFEVSQDQTAVRFRREFARQTTYDVPVSYRVTALGLAACTSVKSVTYKADPAFKKAMVRAVIPLVGSAPGANGAQFKTSLRLRATDSTQQKGKLVFHPIGVPATGADPSIPYNLLGSDSAREWDDIVAAFGMTGLGTIDIVPDVIDNVVSRVPIADVRLFNVTAQGTFGTLESQTQPFSFHEDNLDADAGLSVTVPGPELRLNMGVRTFLDSDVDIVVSRNGQEIVDRTITMVGDLLQFTTAAAFAGVELQAGDQITLRVRGAGVPLYSLTDNHTNDPALFVPPTLIQYVVDKYQILD